MKVTSGPQGFLHLPCLRCLDLKESWKNWGKIVLVLVLAQGTSLILWLFFFSFPWAPTPLLALGGVVVAGRACEWGAWVVLGLRQERGARWKSLPASVPHRLRPPGGSRACALSRMPGKRACAARAAAFGRAICTTQELLRAQIGWILSNHPGRPQAPASPPHPRRIAPESPHSLLPGWGLGPSLGPIMSCCPSRV